MKRIYFLCVLIVCQNIIAMDQKQKKTEAFVPLKLKDTALLSPESPKKESLICSMYFLGTDNEPAYNVNTQQKKVKVYENYVREVSIEKNKSVDLYMETLLHEAVRAGDFQEIKKLLEDGARVDIVNKQRETPLHLMVKHEKYTEIRECFEKKGYIFIPHQDLCDSSVTGLLKDNGAGFDKVLSSYALSEDKIATMMEWFNKIFIEAKRNEWRQLKGCLVTLPTMDCLGHMRILDLYELSEIFIVKRVQEIAAAYFFKDTFIAKCNEQLYEEAAAIVKLHQRLAQELCFNRYIMQKLVLNKTRECWEFLVKQRFNINIVDMHGSPLLNILAGAQNKEALYVLIYHGADCLQKNARDKHCIDLLLTQMRKHQQSAQEHGKARECLQSIQQACRDRTIFLYQQNILSASENKKLQVVEDLISISLASRGK